MRGRFLLLLPWIVGVVVLVVIGWGSQRQSVTLATEAHAGEPESGHTNRNRPGFSAHVDPVCNMEVGENIASRSGGSSWYFCTEQCREMFNRDPERYLAETCLVCRVDDRFTPVGAEFEAVWQERTFGFCTAAHRDAFRAAPLDYFMHSMWGLPGWLYYTSVALILILSFALIEWRSARPEPSSERPRVDLLGAGWRFRLFKSPAFRFVLRLIVVFAFLGILVAGLFGNQLPARNIAPLLTWTIWWGGLIWLVAYLGKMWCYVCPWDTIAEWSERLQLWGRRRGGMGLGLAWPRALRNIWPATFFFVGLTWIELGFGVTLNPRVTAWLGLLILILAFMSAFVFDRKSFCRYGCLVGRVSGLYALFSPVEVRARDREVCRTCTTQSCYRGNEQGDGCPTFEYPATMTQNTYCIMCMECLKTCEAENVTLRLRPWGEDLLTARKPRADEAYLALIMLSLTGLHGLTMTAAWRDAKAWIGATFGVGEVLAFSIGMAAVMLAPILLYAALVATSRWLSGVSTVGYRAYFMRYAYALLPIALFYHLAHNSEHLLMEGQKVLALVSDPLGAGWNLLGTAGWTLQPLVNLPTLWLLQVFFVAIGHIFSLWAARRAASLLFPDFKTAMRSQIPMLVAMILFSLVSLWLLKQPMEMRTSAM